jgi:O-antigen ligase
LGIVQYVLALRAGQTPYQARDAASAAMTGRVVLATLIAMAVPLAPLWILPLFVVGLVVTASYVGVAAALFGFFVAHPTLMVPAFLVSAPALFVVCWYRRRAGDSWRARVRAWQLGLAAVVRGGWPAIFFGLGPGAWRRDATYWNRAAGATVEVFTTAHNDLVETLFEYGLLGMLALGLWGWTLAPGMAFGDPVTGAMVAALVCAMGHFPAALPQTSIQWLVIAGLLARRGI